MSCLVTRSVTPTLPGFQNPEADALFLRVENHFDLATLVSGIPISFAGAVGVVHSLLRLAEFLDSVVERIAEVEAHVAIAGQVAPDKTFDHLLVTDRKGELAVIGPHVRILAAVRRNVVGRAERVK